MNYIERLIELLRRAPKASKVASIQAAEAFKALHARATKYVRSNKQTATQTLSFISELENYQ